MQGLNGSCTNAIVLSKKYAIVLKDFIFVVIIISTKYLNELAMFINYVKHHFMYFMLAIYCLDWYCFTFRYWYICNSNLNFYWYVTCSNVIACLHNLNEMMYALCLSVLVVTVTTPTTRATSNSSGIIHVVFVDGYIMQAKY